MGKYKEIRTLKTEGRSRRYPHGRSRRRSLEDPLLEDEAATPENRSFDRCSVASSAADEAVAAVDAEAAAAAEAVEAGEAPPALPPGPFSRTRTGSSLWRVARGRLGEVRNLEAVPEAEAVTSPSSARRRSLDDTLGGADNRRQSIIEKMMFTLSRAPSFMSHGSGSFLSDAGDGGEGGDAAVPAPPKFIPGAWAPRSDAHFLWHM